MICLWWNFNSAQYWLGLGLHTLRRRSSGVAVSMGTSFTSHLNTFACTAGVDMVAYSSGTDSLYVFRRLQICPSIKPRPSLLKAISHAPYYTGNSYMPHTTPISNWTYFLVFPVFWWFLSFITSSKDCPIGIRATFQAFWTRNLSVVWSFLVVPQYLAHN